MAYRRVPFAEGERYHCFSRGIDKRTIFEDRDDYRRFQQLLYLANDSKSVDRSSFSHVSHDDIFVRDKESPIVEVEAYCLMPNHFHVLLREICEDGIVRFMQKLLTGYVMYFNEKYDRVGNLMVKPFRSKHVNSDVYLHRVAQYIHFNPAEVFEPQWKSGRVKNMRSLERDLRSYDFSSLVDYADTKARPEKSILDMRMLEGALPQLSRLLEETREYYAEIEREF